MDKKQIKYQLKKIINKEVFDLFVECKAMLVGGALTSLLTRQPVNDFDIYFKSEEDFLKAVGDLKKNDILSPYELCFLGSTDKSATFRMAGSDIKVQYIHQAFYPDVTSVFDDFDFTINMVGYDFESDKVIYNKNALHHIAQRMLVVNPKTKFPLISVLRVGKYVDRGYYISKKEMVKLLIAVTGLEIKSYDDVKKHVGGMYGVNIDKLLDTKQPFSLNGVIEQFNNLDLDALDKANFEGGCLEKFIQQFILGIDLSKLPYIKYVLKTETDGHYTSWYHNKFMYQLGTNAIPEGTGRNAGIYCSTDFASLNGGYGNSAERVLIQVDPLDPNETMSPFKKGVRVVRELPFIKNTNDWVNWLVEEGYVDSKAASRLRAFNLEDLTNDY